MLGGNWSGACNKDCKIALRGKLHDLEAVYLATKTEGAPRMGNNPVHETVH